MSCAPDEVKELVCIYDVLYMEVIMKKNIRLFIEEILSTIEVVKDKDKAAAVKDKYGREYIDMIREALYDCFVAGKK